MLLAHAPAGYLLTRLLSRTIFKNSVDPKRSDRLYQLLMVAGIIGAILPDFDFLYQIFFGSRKDSHHAYITHIPLFWVGICSLLVAVGYWRKNRHFIAVAITGCMSALLHLGCDTITGVIYWFAPLGKKGINLFAVSDVHLWWVHNYTYHWTFLLEIAIVAVAMIYFLRVKETITGLVLLFRHSPTLRAITLRITVCTIGVALVILVGSLRFNIDNRIVDKMNKIRHHVVKMAFKS